MHFGPSLGDMHSEQQVVFFKTFCSLLFSLLETSEMDGGAQTHWHEVLQVLATPCPASLASISLTE